MRGRPTAAWSAIAVLLMGIAVQLPTCARSLVSLDEGQLSAIAARLLGGDVLYRDVYTGIFPGIYWLAELLFASFGVDVLVLRSAQVVVNALTATCLFLLARPLAPGMFSWLVPIGYFALATVSFPVFTMLTYSSTSLLCALGALLAAREFATTGQRRWGILLGLLLAACVLFKQNYGALTLAAFGVSLVWVRNQAAFAAMSLLEIVLPPVLAGLFVAVLAGSALASTGAWEKFLESTFFTLFHSQLEAFDQPIPPIFGPHPTGDGKFLFFYGPGGMFGAMMHGHWWASAAALSRAARLGYGSAVLALLLLPFVAWRFARSDDAASRLTSRLVVPFAGLFFLGIFPSAIWSHLAAVYPPLLVVLAASASSVAVLLEKHGSSARAAVSAIALAVTLPIGATAAAVAADVRESAAESHALQGASLLLSRRDAALYGAGDQFLRSCSAPSDPVFVAPDMPFLYVSSGRRNPTPYDLVIPGDVRDEVLVREIERSGVRCVVFNPSMYVQFRSFDVLFPQLSSLLSNKFTEKGRVSEGGATWRFLERRGDAT